MRRRYYNHKVIQDYIKERKITIKEFCEMCKISYNQHKRILNDDNVHIDALFKISKVLLIPFNEMFIVKNYNRFSGVELYK